jgi:hypothetical protein
MQISSPTSLAAYASLSPLSASAGNGSDDFQNTLDGASGTSQAAASSAASQSTSKGAEAAQNFLNYMKETPAQQMADSWLAAHHLTQKDLAAMSPEKRQAIEKQMASEIQQQLKEEAQKKKSVGSQLDIVA